MNARNCTAVGCGVPVDAAVIAIVYCNYIYALPVGRAAVVSQLSSQSFCVDIAKFIDVPGRNSIADDEPRCFVIQGGNLEAADDRFPSL